LSCVVWSFPVLFAGGADLFIFVSSGRVSSVE
jgi:hypothetical protein